MIRRKCIILIIQIRLIMNQCHLYDLYNNCIRKLAIFIKIMSAILPSLPGESQIGTSLDQQSTISNIRIIIILIYIALVGYAGTIPFRWAVFQSNKFLKAMCNTFAGAIFFNVAVLHILPEANYAMEKYLNPNNQDVQSFPLAFLLMILGFLMTVFLTKGVPTHQHSSKTQNQSQVELHTFPTSSSLNATLIEDKLNVYAFSSTNQHAQQTKRYIYLLTTAIYIHTIFQGISIGIQTKAVSLISTAVVIGMHKWADAFSLGMLYKNSNFSALKTYGLIGSQALLNGLAIGIGGTMNGRGELTQSIFLALSAGIFLAMSITHILNEELGDKKYVCYKFGVMVLASALMVCIWFVEKAFDMDTTM